MRFIDYPDFVEIPSEYVDIDWSSEEYRLTCYRFDWEPRKDYPALKEREIRRPALETRMMNSPRGLMVARQRALLLADGLLRFDPDEYHADADVPWEGVERSHPNDDRRPPLLWIAGGLGQTLVDPQDPSWKRFSVVDGVRQPSSFRTSFTVEDMRPDVRDRYHHLGLVPQFPAAPAPPAEGAQAPEVTEDCTDVSVAKVWTQLNFGARNYVTISGAGASPESKPPSMKQVIRRDTYASSLDEQSDDRLIQSIPLMNGKAKKSLLRG